MAGTAVENIPIGTEARAGLIDTRTQEIMMGRLAIIHTNDIPGTYGHPVRSALNEIMAGYTQGDITPEKTIFYYQRLQPWLSDNERGISEEDIVVFSGLKTGKHVVADNQIRRLAGKPPALAAQEAPTSMPLRSHHGWARSGIDLAVTFDAQPTPEQDDGALETRQQSAQFDFTVSMHGLYDRLAVGKHDISEYVDNRYLTTLQGNETCWQHATDAFNSPLPFEAWGDAVLLRSLYESGFSEHVRAPSLQRLAQSVAANTDLLLGMHTKDPSNEPARPGLGRSYNINEARRVADFIAATRIGSPGRYGLLLNMLGTQVVKSPFSNHLDERTQLIALSTVPDSRKATLSRLTDLNIGEVMPVYVDLLERGHA